jgi:hypothetical protein
MIADEFVMELARMAPSLEELLALGCPEVAASERIAAFEAKPRLTSDATPADDPLLDLIGRYDTTTLEIGLMAFNQYGLRYYRAALLAQRQVIVALYEVDPVAVCLDSGNVIQVDHAEPSYTMARWARDGGAFLEAILKWAAFVPPFGRERYDAPLWEPTREEIEANNAAARAWASECARIAGLDASESGVYESALLTYWNWNGDVARF